MIKSIETICLFYISNLFEIVEMQTDNKLILVSINFANYKKNSN